MPSDATREAQALILSAGMSSFIPTSPAYIASVVSNFENKNIPITLIQPPVRNLNTQNFNQARAHRLLKAIQQGVELPPVEVDEPPSHTLGVYIYRLCDGFHRFYLSEVLGFTHLPVVIKPYFNLETN